MFATFSELPIDLTLYTDALIVRGTTRTRQRRITDILNASEAPFVVLEDVSATAHDGVSEPVTAAIAQINLDAVLFAVVDARIETPQELRTPKTGYSALVSIPPFRVTGTIHLLTSALDLREALTDLTGRFLPVTDAEFEAPSRGIGLHRAVMLAVNHHRAQILAQVPEPADPRP